MNIDDLNDKGWCQARISSNENLHDVLSEYAHKLGTPIKARKSTDIVQRLVPISRDRAHPSSLSSKHSTGAFPLHVDTAHWTIPCRYLVFGCLFEGESIRPTILLDFNSLLLTIEEKDYLYNSPFIIKNGRSSFYGSILTKNRAFIRYDSGCMTPVSKTQCKMKCLLSSKRVTESLTEITWEKGMILVVDNWRIMHGRGASIKNGLDRELYRVLVS